MKFYLRLISKNKIIRNLYLLKKKAINLSIIFLYKLLFLTNSINFKSDFSAEFVENSITIITLIILI